MSTQIEEKQKYDKCWDTDGYRNHSPGENSLKAFEQIVSPNDGSYIMDFGSGTGRASLALAMAGHKVTMLDITEKSMDKTVRNAVKEMRYLEFYEGCLWDREWMGEFFTTHGYCCDVMEHIPTEYVMLTLSNIMRCAKTGVFFYICLVPDAFGKLIGKPLHLTVKPFEWWRDRLSEFGEVVEARDLISNGLYYVKKRGVHQ